MLKHFNEFILENIKESVCVDGIPADNTILSLTRKLIEEGKSEYVIRSFFYSIGVPIERVEYALKYFENTTK